ncbi:hypothetical protein I4I80_24690 [Pseudomonas syringae pv. tomato]|nr:hypothetical protein [Pseudomonas syringae pv. tomato]
MVLAPERNGSTASGVSQWLEMWVRGSDTNLQTFAESGDSYDMRKIKDMENKGLIKRTPNAKA